MLNHVVTSSNTLHASHRYVRLFDCQISGVSKNLARWYLLHTRSGNEHWEYDFFIFYETKHSIMIWRNQISYLNLNKAASQICEHKVTQLTDQTMYRYHIEKKEMPLQALLRMKHEIGWVQTRPKWSWNFFAVSSQMTC